MAISPNRGADNVLESIGSDLKYSILLIDFNSLSSFVALLLASLAVLQIL